MKNLLSGAYGKSLEPLFHLFLYTTDKLEIYTRQTRENDYQVRLLNLDMTVPVDIQTDAGIQRIMVDKKGTTVTSKTPILVDPKIFYLKKVIME